LTFGLPCLKALGVDGPAMVVSYLGQVLLRSQRVDSEKCKTTSERKKLS